MDKEAFLYICEQLGENIKKEDTNFRKAVPVEMRVAMALYFFSGTSVS